jgi:predicted dehydrogenase
MTMEKVRLGIIGVGGMGAHHVRSVLETPNTIELAAVCDMNQATAEKVAAERKCQAFFSAEEMFRSGAIDAVLIATPHYSHTPLAIQAFEHDLHVLVEKPIAVHKADAEIMISAHAKKPNLVFSIMFNLRTEAVFQKIKSLLDQNELGTIRRINWTTTDWFRSQFYYDSGSWRATWKGEGGGVLLNQCPHQLDLFQWFFGMPTRITAFCRIGKYHTIEVEDDVTAYMEFEDGHTATFIASTGEAPGTQRLEIAADRGRLVLEKGKLHFDRSVVSVQEFIRTTQKRINPPEIWNIEIPVAAAQGSTHQKVIANFADAILKGVPPVARAEDGIHSVELANAILLSALRKKTVELPMDGTEYKMFLDEQIANSKKV